MNVDSDIAPLLEKMDVSMQTIRGSLLPMLAKLEEDTLVSQYSLEEQARLSLSAAFAVAFSLYSLDKLQNKQHPHVQNVAGQSMSPTTDAQLVLKIERITDYIKKLREITLLQRQQQQDGSVTTTTATSESAAGAGHKRHTRSTEETTNASHDPVHKSAKGETSADTEVNAMGDTEMFSVVSRIPGERGTIVSRLVNQSQAANNVTNASS